MSLSIRVIFVFKAMIESNNKLKRNILFKSKEYEDLAIIFVIIIVRNEKILLMVT